MSEVVNETANPYSRMLAVEVWNFMSLEHARVDFDERNIINLKGYNDSGKSAMLTALRVCLFNANPSKQAGFIQDDKDYFRVIVYFDDGVSLLRDKYVNGQSLMEMYKDGKCIYSTKNGKALTRFTDIPQPIADYLGLIVFDGSCLNARSCFEKQIGVQTTGSENYKMFNTVLKAEEIATASTLLNNDRNKLLLDINTLDSDIQSHKALLGDGLKVTSEMVDWLKVHDRQLDALDSEVQSLGQIKSLSEEVDSVPVMPEITIVDITQLAALEGAIQLMRAIQDAAVPPEVATVEANQLTELAAIVSLSQSLSAIAVPPEVSGVDSTQLDELATILYMSQVLATVGVAPELSQVSTEQMDTLGIIKQIIDNLASCNAEIAEDERQLVDVAAELETLRKEASRLGTTFVKCPSCGELFDPAMAHVD